MNEGMQEDFDVHGSPEQRRLEFDAFIVKGNEAAVALSQAALKALLLLNGGAAVAMLGFVASIASNRSGTRLDMQAVLWALQSFSAGASLAVLATGVAYVVMYLQVSVVKSFQITSRPPFYKSSSNTDLLNVACNSFHIVAVMISCMALGAFVLGVMWTGDILLNVSEPK